MSTNLGRGDQPDWRRLDALEATISAIAGSQVPCGTLDQRIRRIDVSNHSELDAALVFLRRLRDLSGAARPLRSADWPRDRERTRYSKGFIWAPSFRTCSRRQNAFACDRSKPAWSSILRTRALVAGRLRPGPRRTCPFCGYRGVLEMIGSRPHGLCPGCGSLERHRFIVSTVGPAIRRRARNRRALMLAPDPLLGMLRSAFEQVVTADIARDDIDLKFDLQRLPSGQRRRIPISSWLPTSWTKSRTIMRCGNASVVCRIEVGSSHCANSGGRDND